MRFLVETYNSCVAGGISNEPLLGAPETSLANWLGLGGPRLACGEWLVRTNDTYETLIFFEITCVPVLLAHGVFLVR